MTSIDVVLLTSAIWLAPSCRRSFQAFMGITYLLIAVVMIVRQ